MVHVFSEVFNKHREYAIISVVPLMDIPLTVRFCLFFRILIGILIYFVPFFEFCFGAGVPESFVEVTASAFPFEGSCPRVSDSDKLYLINNIALIIHLVYLSDIQNGVHDPGVDA